MLSEPPRTELTPSGNGYSGRARTMSPAALVALLSMLLGIQPVTTDLYLPALPDISKQFGAPFSLAQATLSAMLLAFGTSQLAWGPLSDRYGRRPILLIGTALYALAAIGCVLATSMTWLLFWRVFEGAAMGAPVMCARAVVRDLFLQTKVARTMSHALTGLGVIACLSTLTGGVLAESLGWRITMASIAVFGLLVAAFVAVKFVETLPSERRAVAGAAATVATWARILSHPTFIASSALTTATFCGIVTYMAASSFVYIGVLGLSRTQYGIVLFSVSLLFIAGTVLCRHLLGSLGLRRTVMFGGVLSLAGGTLLGVLALAEVRSVWAIQLPFSLYMLGHGIHQSCGQAAAIAPFPRAAGTASALAGFVMMLFAFGVGSWVGIQWNGSLTVLSNGVWFWSACVAAVAWTIMRRHGDVAANESTSAVAP